MRENVMEINVKKFMFTLNQLPNFTQQDLAKECGVSAGYFSELKNGKRKGISPSVFKYICLKYRLNENDFKPISEEPPTVSDDAVMTGILSTLQSINKNQFEIIRVLKSMSDTAVNTEGKVTNCNVNTSEMQKLLRKLCEAMGVEL